MDFFKYECIKHFDSVDFTSFECEFNRLQTIKKHAKKYYKNGFLNDRLFVNHIIILYNFFGAFATNMIFKAVPLEHWGLVITILIYLNRMPETIPYTDIKVSDFPLDYNIKDRLERL